MLNLIGKLRLLLREAKICQNNFLIAKNRTFLGFSKGGFSSNLKQDRDQSFRKV